MRNKILLGLVALCIFSSCKSPWYQISTLESEDVDQTFKFENDVLTLQYDFWSNGGKLNFTITNNSDKPIFIDWERSNFIFNGYSKDYFTDQETIESTGIYKTKSIAGKTLIYTPYSQSSTTDLATKSTAIREKKNIQIPPRSYINSKTFNLYFPWIKTEHSKISLSKENTPLQIRTYIAYSKEKSFESLEYIDNEFWLKDIEEFNGKEFTKNQSKRTFYTVGQKVERKLTIIGTGFISLFVILVGISVNN